MSDMEHAIEIIQGHATAASAHLYVRLQSDGSLGGQISGKLTGPQCRYARTLPVDYQINQLASETGVLAEVVVPDPCFWTPELPFLYQLELAIDKNQGVVHRVSRLVGIRHWGTEGANLRLNRRRTVLRGVVVPDVADAHDLVATAHQLNVALAIPRPDDDLCESASNVGVALLADLREELDARKSLVRLSRWPAAMVALLNSDFGKEHAIDKSQLSGLVVAQAIDATRPYRAKEIAGWADCLALYVSNIKAGSIAPFSQCKLPMIALRPSKGYAGLSQARAACDRLQAELAPQLDLAGYFV